MALNLGLVIRDEDGASEESKYLTKLFFMGPEPKNWYRPACVVTKMVVILLVYPGVKESVGFLDLGQARTIFRSRIY